MVMGTRSITVVKDDNGRKIIEMYRQMDGYPSGMGQDLKDFINSGKKGDGIGMDKDYKQFNGIECFAAQLVAEMKDDSGGIYLHAPTTDFKDKQRYQKQYWAEYYYEIDADLNLRCWDTSNNEEMNLADELT